MAKKKKYYTYADIREEYLKCVLDTSRRYMIENYLSTFDATQKKRVPFTLFPRQVVLVDALRDYDNVITIKSRQEGITTTVAAKMACEMVLASRESPENVLCIGNKLDLSQQMVTKIKEFIYQLPRWFFGDEFFSMDKKDVRNDDKKNPIFSTCNKDKLELACNGSMAHARSSGENAARGISAVSRLIFDEAAFIEKGKDVYAQALPTISTGGKITMISTPNGKDELYYETYNNARTGKNNFHIVESMWYQDPRYNKNLKWTKTNKETGEITVYKEPTLDKTGKIKYDEEGWRKRIAEGWKPESPWYLNMCESFNNNTMKIAQELDVSFLGSSDNVVAPEYIRFQETNNVREPIYQDNIISDFWIWKEPIEGHRYIIACDASRGDSSDATSIQIIDIDGEENGYPIIEQVAEYNGKMTGDEVGDILFDYGIKYNAGMIVVDCIGGTGDAAILTLMRLGYPNLYYDDPNLKTYTIQRKYADYNLTAEDRLPGFHSGSVRFNMLTKFAAMVKNNEFKIRSTRVISELETWIFKGDTGRIDHMHGKHDDNLTCIAMGLFVLEFSFRRLESTKSKDMAMLKAWTAASPYKSNSNRLYSQRTVNISENSHKYVLPFYNQKALNNTLRRNTASDPTKSASMWIVGYGNRKN